MRVFGDLAKIAIKWPFGHFWSRFFAQKSCPVCALSAFYLEDNAICAAAFRRFKRGLLFRQFLKNFPWSPLCTLSENEGFGWPCKNCHNLAIRVLSEPLFYLTILSSLCTWSAFYLEDNTICASAFRPFKRGLLFGRFLKNFSWSPLCIFLENAGFGWPCENCNHLAIRALLEPLFSPKSVPVFAL